MTSIKKTAAVALVLAFGALTVAPVASAIPADDLLARTFYGVRAPLVEWKEFGIGWYDPGNGNLCLFALAGIQNDLGTGLYHENGRVYTNAYSATPVPKVIPNTVVACPGVFGAPPGTYALVFPAFNVIAGTLIDQSAILCSQHPAFVDCIPEPADWNWDLYACEPLAATFGDTIDNKGVFVGTPLDGVLLSSFITCAPNHGHDASPKLNTFGPNAVGTFFSGVPAAVIAHNGRNHQYVVSCLNGEVTEQLTVAPFTTTPNVVQEAHDWALVLDVGSLNAGNAAYTAAVLQHHLVAGPLQGLFDLGDNNDCPVIGNNACALENGKVAVTPKNAACDLP